MKATKTGSAAKKPAAKARADASPPGKLAEGKKAPPFSLSDDAGKPVSLRDFAGRWVVLYFYPRDSTPGCTRQACAFRDSAAPLKKAGAVVVGVSRDSVQSHVKFKTAQKLN